MSSKKIKHRSVVHKDLLQRKYKPRVIVSKKLYSRKGKKNA